MKLKYKVAENVNKTSVSNMIIEQMYLSYFSITGAKRLEDVFFSDWCFVEVVLKAQWPGCLGRSDTIN